MGTTILYGLHPFIKIFLLFDNGDCHNVNGMILFYFRLCVKYLDEKVSKQRIRCGSIEDSRDYHCCRCCCVHVQESLYRRRNARDCRVSRQRFV